MRFFVGGLFHECNAFSPVPAGLGDFKACGDGQGPPMAPAQARSEVLGWGDLVHAASEAGHEVFQGAFFEAQPSAPVDAASFDALCSGLLDSLRRALAEGPVDGVLLYLHGAQTAGGTDDCEGVLLARLRAVPGLCGAPVGVLLDLHGNLTQAMLAHADVLLACREYPHTDYADRAAELVAMIAAAAAGAWQPRMQFWQLPMSGLLPTHGDMARELLARMGQLERHPAVRSVSVFHGFAWADHADACASVLIVSRGKLPGAWNLARPLAEQFVAACDRFLQDHPLIGVDDALRQAALAPAGPGPVVLADRGDNPGAGGAGDTTALLHAVLDRGLQGCAFALLHDPAAVAQAHAMAPGDEAEFSIGGRSAGAGAPVRARMRVLCLRSDARQSLFASGLTQPLGRSALLEVGGVRVVVNDARQQVFGPQVFSEHGIDPAGCRLLVVKSTNHFRAGFAGLARHIVLCDPPGSTGEDLRGLPFRRLRRPLWPLDELSLAERARPRD